MKTVQNSPFTTLPLFSSLFSSLVTFFSWWDGGNLGSGGRWSRWLGWSWYYKRKNKTKQITQYLTKKKKNSCVTSSLRTAALLYSGLVQSDSQTMTECADRVQLCLPRWLGSRLNHWPVTAATHWHTDMRVGKKKRIAETLQLSKELRGNPLRLYFPFPLRGSIIQFESESSQWQWVIYVWCPRWWQQGPPCSLAVCRRWSCTAS